MRVSYRNERKDIQRRWVAKDGGNHGPVGRTGMVVNVFLQKKIFPNGTLISQTNYSQTKLLKTDM